jgi:hypothetical protein
VPADIRSIDRTSYVKGHQTNAATGALAGTKVGYEALALEAIVGLEGPNESRARALCLQQELIDGGRNRKIDDDGFGLRTATARNDHNDAHRQP